MCSILLRAHDLDKLIRVMDIIVIWLVLGEEFEWAYIELDLNTKISFKNYYLTDIWDSLSWISLVQIFQDIFILHQSSLKTELIVVVNWTKKLIILNKIFKIFFFFIFQYRKSSCSLYGGHVTQCNMCFGLSYDFS